MTAGQPNWEKLHKMGKLPKEARGKVPMLRLLDQAETRIKELEAKIVELRAGGDSSEGSKSPEKIVPSVKSGDKVGDKGDKLSNDAPKVKA